MKWMSHSMENGQYTDDIHHELARYHIYWPALSHFNGVLKQHLIIESNRETVQLAKYMTMLCFYVSTIYFSM